MGYFKDAIKGVSWMGALRASIRGIAFLRLVILARILVPFQFGLFGIVSLVLAFLEMLTETGINVFFIQEEGKLKDYIDTAWVVSIVRGILISFLIILTAPFISLFFNSPQAYQLLLLTSLVPFLRGFINPAIVKFQKELAFGKEFLVRFSVFFTDALASVVIALITKSAASLVWGLIVGAFFEVILSFLFIKPRPRFSFEPLKARTVVGRGKWIALAGVFDYVFNHGDDIVVGKLLETSSLGIYQVAYKISTLPITEVANVFNKVSFPVFVKISNDLERLKKAYLKTTLAVTLLVIPLGLTLFLFAEEVVLLILGETWFAAIPVLKILAIFGVIRAISGPSSALYLSVKKQEYVTGYTFLSILGLGFSIVPLVIRYGIVGAGISATIGLFVSLPLMAYYSWRILRSS